jgi:hypothetical protein
MRSIPLRVVEVVPFGASAPEPFKYADAILGVLSHPHAERGMNLTEMQQAVSIIGAVKKADADGADAVYLEEADWAYLQQRVAETKWRMVDPAIVAFGEAIRTAETFDPNARKAA